MSKLNSKGFTVVELMIATMIFTVILLLCTYGLVRIGQIYYKGVLSARVQNTARSIEDDIITKIKYGGESHGGGGEDFIPDPLNPGEYIVPEDKAAAICIGVSRYSFIISKDAADSRLIYDEPALADCDVPADMNTLLPGQKNLLPKGMRLSKFSLRPYALDLSSQSVAIRVKITAGEPDLFENGVDGNGDPINKGCKGGAGDHFCASSDLVTYATPRVKLK